MLFDLAKSGWVEGDTSDDDDDFESEGLLKIAANLTKVAKSVRVKYRHPIVRLVLPRIRIRECHKEIAKILQKIKDLGVILETAEDIPDTSIPIPQARDRMAPEPFDGFSDTLNVDTTLLLAFASDLSHDSVESKDWHHHSMYFSEQPFLNCGWIHEFSQLRPQSGCLRSLYLMKPASTLIFRKFEQLLIPRFS